MRRLPAMDATAGALEVGNRFHDTDLQTSLPKLFFRPLAARY